MNIFILDKDPVHAAIQQCDKHVVKMILESAQMLSTAHRVLDGKMEVIKSKNNRNVKTWILEDERETTLYKSAHVNHPCSIWCRESMNNYFWLFNHFKTLCDEFTHRFGKIHKSQSLLDVLQDPPKVFRSIYKTQTLTPFAVAISEQIYPGVKTMSDDPVLCYREYYRRKNAEQFEMKWTKREQPEWMK